MSPTSRTPSQAPLWTFPLAAVLLVAVWQWITVTANFGGNWTALYCTGALQKLPPLVASEHVYVFANSTGYDGQFYHYVAHDPFLRSNLKSYVDDPQLRYRRILIPLLAYSLALGGSRWIDPVYELVLLLSLGLGVYWSCRFAGQAKLPVAWGLLFLLAPATPIAVDRLVVDAGLAALTVAFLYYWRSPWKLFPVLACAALARESGVLLIAAYCAYLLWRREIRMTAIFSLSGLPALAWFAYVHTHTAAATLGPRVLPFSAILTAMANPWHYPPGMPFLRVVLAADYLALAGLALAFGLSILWFLRKPADPALIAGVLFTSMGLLLHLQHGNILQNVYHFGRVYTPLLLCLAATAAQYRKPWLLAPAALMLPRLAIQLTGQLLGVMHWMV